jgi:rhodanese-related sulfurtransferase
MDYPGRLALLVRDSIKETLVSKVFSILAALGLVLAAASLVLAADAPKNERKQTKLGKYVTAVEAYAMYQKEPGKVAIVDVRTPEEYNYTGHPAMAHNIPVMFWTGKFDPGKKQNPLAENPDFVGQVKAKFKPGDRIVVMCRSGDRGAMAANKLAEAGFTDVYNMIDGFEGDAVSDQASPDFGKRVKDGWKNSAIPWTYDLDEKLVFLAP